MSSNSRQERLQKIVDSLFNKYDKDQSNTLEYK